MDRLRPEDRHAARRAALRAEAHHPSRRQHLLVLVERPPRVARPVPDPPAPGDRGAAVPRAAGPGGEGPAPRLDPRRGWRPHRGRSAPRAQVQGGGDGLRPLSLALRAVRVSRGGVPRHPHHLRVAGDPGHPGGNPPGRRVAADPRRLPQPGNDVQGERPTVRGGGPCREAAPRPRRGRQEPRRDEPRATPLGVRDRGDRLRPALAGPPGGPPGPGREPGGRPRGRHPGSPGSRVPEAAGETVRGRSQGLRGRPRHRSPEPERQEGPHRGAGGPPAGAPRPRRPPRQGALPRGRLRDPHEAEPRPPRRVRPVTGQRPVGRPIDPEALPDGRRGSDADLRPPPRTKAHHAWSNTGGPGGACIPRKSGTRPRLSPDWLVLGGRAPRPPRPSARRPTAFVPAPGRSGAVRPPGRRRRRG